MKNSSPNYNVFERQTEIHPKIILLPEIMLGNRLNNHPQISGQA